MTEGSKLLPTIRAMQAAHARWRIALDERGELDQASFTDMVMLRRSLYQEEPCTPLDRLLVLGGIAVVTAYSLELFKANEKPTAQDFDIMRGLFSEVAAGLEAILPHFEREAKATLADIGAFQDKATMN